MTGRLTTDPTHPDLTHGNDTEPVEQAKAYLVLSDEERAQGFVRPVRRKYVHQSGCGGPTTMGTELAETYARDPKFYDGTYCAACKMHRPVSEFVWDGTEDEVGS